MAEILLPYSRVLKEHAQILQWLEQNHDIYVVEKRQRVYKIVRCGNSPPKDAEDGPSTVKDNGVDVRKAQSSEPSMEEIERRLDEKMRAAGVTKASRIAS